MREGSRIKPFKSEGCNNKYIAFDMNLKPRILDKQDDKYLYQFDWLVCLLVLKRSSTVSMIN